MKGLRQPTLGYLAASTINGAGKERHTSDPACSWRQRIIRHAESNIGTVRYQAVLLALAFGERGALEPSLRSLMLKLVLLT